jgi:hypothetical protein
MPIPRTVRKTTTRPEGGPLPGPIRSLRPDPAGQDPLAALSRADWGWAGDLHAPRLRLHDFRPLNRAAGP